MKRRRIALVLVPFVIACNTENPTTAPDLAVSYARGGGGGKTSTKILPVVIANPRDLGCDHIAIYGVNNALTTGATGYCMDSEHRAVLMWNASTGASVVPGGNGFGYSISDDGTIVGNFEDRPFYKPAGGTVTHMPGIGDDVSGNVYAISPDGSHAVGFLNGFTGDAIWTRSGTEWTPAAFAGDPQDVSTGGLLIVGSSGSHAAAWTNSNGEWNATMLPDDGAMSSSALAVAANGGAIAGYINFTSPYGNDGNQPVAWVPDGAGGWTLIRLAGPASTSSSASGVEFQADGSLLVVGSSKTTKPGAGESGKGLVWRRRAGSTSFDAPLTLEPVSKGANAYPHDVNSKGEVVGTSTAFGGSYGVMWTFR